MKGLDAETCDNHNPNHQLALNMEFYGKPTGTYTAPLESMQAIFTFFLLGIMRVRRGINGRMRMARSMKNPAISSTT